MKEYPVNLTIDYSEQSDRLTAILRLILVIPIVIILALISTYAEALSLAIAMMILFKEKYPKWWFCLLYTSPSPRDAHESRMPSSA